MIVTARDGDGATASASVTIELTAGSGNSLPSFGSATIFREVSENQPRGTDVGAPVTATDADGEELTYGLAGTDVLLFRIDDLTGQIETRRSLDHEARQSYALMVSASDGTDTTTVELTIRVLDEDEPPGRPGQPTVRPVDGSVTSLLATWFRVSNAGRPLVGGYDLQYRKEGDPDWADGPPNVPFPRAEVGGLEADTAYEVQVRAVNAEGEGDPAVFELTRSPGDEDSGAQEIRLDLLLEGDPFVDSAPWTVTFEADAATASLSLATKKDDAVEDGRRILYRVRRGSQAPPAYLVGSPAAAERPARRSRWPRIARTASAAP